MITCHSSTYTVDHTTDDITTSPRSINVYNDNPNNIASIKVQYFTDRSKAVLGLRIFYVFVLSCVCYVFVRVCLYVLCGHLLGKGWPLGSRLWCLLWVCHFPIGILGQVWYLIVSIPDLCTLTYFNASITSKEFVYAHCCLYSLLNCYYNNCWYMAKMLKVFNQWLYPHHACDILVSPVYLSNIHTG